MTIDGKTSRWALTDCKPLYMHFPPTSPCTRAVHFRSDMRFQLGSPRKVRAHDRELVINNVIMGAFSIRNTFHSERPTVGPTWPTDLVNIVDMQMTSCSLFCGCLMGEVKVRWESGKIDFEFGNRFHFFSACNSICVSSVAWVVDESDDQLQTKKKTRQGGSRSEAQTSN